MDARNLQKLIKKNIMKRISKKKLSEFMDSISIIKECDMGIGEKNDAYYSKIDGSYITFVGLEEDMKHFLKRGITEQFQSASDSGEVTSLAFNPTEEKWYGWSHRAIYGFGVGSKCKKGDCHFEPSNKEEFKEDCLNFWGDNEYSVDKSEAHFKTVDGKDGVLVTYVYNDKVPNEAIRGTNYENFSPFPEKWGKGEWTATSLDGAKQMAKDFSEGVS